MFRYKTWMTVGYTFAAIAGALFIGLATHVFLSTPNPDPRFIVLALLDMLLGITASCTIIGGKMCRWIGEEREEFGNQRWWKGYGAAVEDLRAGGEVVDFPVPHQARGRHG